MAKPTYFHPDSFVDEVIKALGLDDGNNHSELREELVTCLSDRIMATIFNSFDQREIKLFEKMLADHPELDPLDAIMMIAPWIDGLKDKLERNINSLYAELVHDAAKVEEFMAIGQTKN